MATPSSKKKHDVQTSRMKRKSGPFKEILPSKKKKTVHYKYKKAEKVSKDVKSETIEEKKVSENEILAAEKPKNLKTVTDVFAYRHKHLEEKKIQIADLCNKVLSRPEESIKSLKDLRQMMEEKGDDLYITVAKLSAASLMEVFKCIIPGYKIRPPTDKERKQKMKKETKSTWDYEEKLLMQYKSYVTSLISMTKGLAVNKRKNQPPVPSHQWKMSLGFTALKCLSELLLTHSHFNFRSNLAAAVIRFAAHPSEEVSDLCCGTIEQIYREDRVGDVSLDVVKQTTAMIKERNYQTNPKVLKTFLSIKIKNINLKREVSDEMNSAKNHLTLKEKKKLWSKNVRKKNKEMEKVERDMEEGQAEVKLQKKTKLHTEITKQVFLTYFRILKKSESSILLPAVLEGLAHFAHLINVDYYGDLFKVFNELIEKDTLSYRERLHCVQTVFTILSGEGDVLNVDPVSFYSHLYNSLFYLTAGVSNQDALIAVNCLDMMLVKRRKKVSRTRVLAFTKRLATLSTQLMHNGSIACLASICRFMQAHRYVDILLDPDCHFGNGIFLPELGEPEHCNPENTALWELHTLRGHYHSQVQKLANHILAGLPLEGKSILPTDIENQSPEELFSYFNSSEMNFRPSVPAPQKQKTLRVSKVSTKENSIEIINILDFDVEKVDFSQLLNQ